MKILLTILLFLSASLSFGQTKKLYRQVEKTKDLKEKIVLLSEIIRLKPKDLDAYFYRAIAQHDIKDYTGAILDYSKIIIEKPDADSYFNRGNSRYSLEDYEGAKRDYAKAFELDKKLIEARFSLGFTKYNLGDFNGAFLDFNAIIQNCIFNKEHLYSGYFKNNYLYSGKFVRLSLNMRALTYKNLGNYADAINDYTILLSIRRNARNYYNRGKLLMDLKFYQKANNDFKNSLAISDNNNNNNMYARFYKGASNLFLGKHLEAIADFNKCLNYDTSDFDAYLGLAIAYNNLNEINQAKLYFEKANNILEIGENLNSIEQYKDTFWFQNQYFHFNNNVNKLVKLIN